MIPVNLSAGEVPLYSEALCDDRDKLMGFLGSRGIEGKILAAKWARENNVPYYGLCLGMQIAVIEFARSVVQLPNANSAEFAPNSPDLIIDLLPDQDANGKKGGTMRLGIYKCELVPDTRAAKAYGRSEIEERHRHRGPRNRYR